MLIRSEIAIKVPGPNLIPPAALLLTLSQELSSHELGKSPLPEDSLHRNGNALEEPRPLRPASSPYTTYQHDHCHWTAPVWDLSIVYCSISISSANSPSPDPRIRPNLGCNSFFRKVVKPHGFCLKVSLCVSFIIFLAFDQFFFCQRFLALRIVSGRKGTFQQYLIGSLRIGFFLENFPENPKFSKIKHFIFQLLNFLAVAMTWSTSSNPQCKREKSFVLPCSTSW